MSAFRYICCCSSRSQSVLEPTSNPLQGQEQTGKIDTDLERKLADWQNILIQCEGLELQLMEQQGDGAKYLLAEIRNSPQSFVANGTDLVATIAKKRIQLQQAQNKLPLNLAVDSEKTEDKDSNRLRAESAARWQVEQSRAGNSVTSKLSSIWSDRLNTVNPTQGAIFIAESNDSNSMIKIRPKWPDYLGDISFDIIKVNKYGQKMNRILKLTQYHVISIRNGTEVTKFFRYEDIRRVWLQNGDTIKVVQRNDKKNMYTSSIAPHILQQIITRVQVRASLDRTNFHEDYQTLGYTLETTEQMIKSISDANTRATEEVLASFANELKLKVVSAEHMDRTSQGNKQSRPASICLSVSGVDDDQEDFSDVMIVKEVLDSIIEEIDTDIKVTSSEVAATRAISNDTKPSSDQQPKFMNFKEESPEYTVQAIVRSLISDGSTAEGNTLRLFVEDFLSSDARVDMKDMLVKVRHFVDGMHEHLVSTRGFKLAVDFQQARQQSLIKSKVDPKVKAISKQAPRRMSINFLKDKGGLAHVDDELLTWISFIVFIVIEETVFLRIKEKLIISLKLQKATVSIYRNDYFILSYDSNNIILKQEEEESVVIKKMKIFEVRDQRDWGIPETFISPLGWRTAIFELSALEHNLTPTSQLYILTRTVKAIYNEFQVAVLPTLQAQGKADTFIAADDLVPIFLYVFCQTNNLRHPIQNRDLMWGLCHPDQLHGESGYYLTIYESAIEFVLQENEDMIGTIQSPLQSKSNSLSSRSLSNNDSQRLSGYLSQVVNSKFHEDQSYRTMRESFI